mgnify:CR=1 FL=1
MKTKRLLALITVLILGFSVFGELPFADSAFSITASAASTVQTKAAKKQTMSKKARASLKRIRKQIKSKNKNVGIAYIGYAKKRKTKKQLRAAVKNSNLAFVCPFLSEVPLENYAFAGGGELFALVPQNNKVSFALYKSTVAKNGKYKNAKKPFYTGKPGEIVILCCNPSDLYSNVLIVAKGAAKNGKALSFRPFISLKTGKLTRSKKYYDFSLYEDQNVTDINIQICYEILFGYDEVRYYMNRGMSVVYLNKKQKINGRPCWIFAAGTNKNDQFVTEQLYGVCDNLVYAYDAVSDSWKALGMG